VDGVCTQCGDCAHDIVLNGACLACGTTALDPIAMSPKPPAVISPARLVRPKPR
jgi:hypothetical protein